MLPPRSRHKASQLAQVICGPLPRFEIIGRQIQAGGLRQQPVQSGDLESGLFDLAAIGGPIGGRVSIDVVGQHERRNLPAGVPGLASQFEGFVQGPIAKRFVADRVLHRTGKQA